MLSSGIALTSIPRKEPIQFIVSNIYKATSKEWQSQSEKEQQPLPPTHVGSSTGRVEGAGNSCTERDFSMDVEVGRSANLAVSGEMSMACVAAIVLLLRRRARNIAAARTTRPATATPAPIPAFTPVLNPLPDGDEDGVVDGVADVAEAESPSVLTPAVGVAVVGVSVVVLVVGIAVVLFAGEDSDVVDGVVDVVDA
jgi:hypothetical protein